MYLSRHGMDFIPMVPEPLNPKLQSKFIFGGGLKKGWDNKLSLPLLKDLRPAHDLGTVQLWRSCPRLKAMSVLSSALQLGRYLQYHPC
ncbi:rCG49069 [Rattus norvegicus]|uniref:RCG49069 n=1 Tax=Rattus norvegicus TaxID=10116 RepID=A6IGX2_RAT|nr:rCG49069 [Rattus norvegicus]